MKTDNAGSAPPSGTTSKGVTQPTPSSDAEFLASQAGAAREAIARTFKEMRADLGQGVSPVTWAKRYPWVAVGAGAVAGFVTAAVLVPSKEQQALRKLAAIERALNPKTHTPTAQSNGHADEKHEDEHASSFLGLIGRELIKTLRPALVSLLSAGVAAATARPSEEDMEEAVTKEHANEADQDEPQADAASS